MTKCVGCKKWHIDKKVFYDSYYSYVSGWNISKVWKTSSFEKVRQLNLSNHQPYNKNN